PLHLTSPSLHDALPISPRVATTLPTATGRPRHVSDLEFLKTHDSVILADLCRDLVNTIQTSVGDTLVNLLHSAPGLLPVKPQELDRKSTRLNSSHSQIS